MGRELRRVPPHWQHPKLENGNYKPLIDGTYEEAGQEWLNECIQWSHGAHELQNEYKLEYKFYWEYAGPPPTPDRYRTYTTETATWYQIYETVSEGTPVSPPFASQEELVEYVVKHGDFWYKQPWTREAAHRFVFEDQFAFSFYAATTKEA